MKNILKKMALLAIPVVLWFAFFVAFEPNNYFGLRPSASSSQPVARVRAYQQAGHKFDFRGQPPCPF